MRKLTFDGLTGKQKAAILLVSIGIDAASKVLKNLSEKDIETLSIEIANLKDVSSDVVEAVVEDFYQMVQAQQYITEGGLDYAQRILEGALGTQKAYEIIHRVQGALHVSGFKMLKTIDHSRLLNFIQNEHPQTIALILAYLEPYQAAMTLTKLPPNLQSEVAYRMATMEKISPELLEEIEKVLETQLESSFGRQLDEAGGTKAVAEILNLAGKSAERKILEDIEQYNPELSQEIKNLMFVFEDILLLDDRSIQRVLKEVDSKVLATALKGTSDTVKSKIFSNMSERAAAMIQEEMEFMGPVRVKEVEDAQRQIVNIIGSLEEQGEIIVVERDKGQEELIA